MGGHGVINQAYSRAGGSNEDTLISAFEKGGAAAESRAAHKDNAAPRPPAQRDHIQHFDQCMRKRHVTTESLRILETTQDPGLLLDAITCNALISACEKGTFPQSAWQLLDTM